MTIAPSAAKTYPNFFMMSSSVELTFNIASMRTFRGNLRRILNSYSATRSIIRRPFGLLCPAMTENESIRRALIDDRLIHQRVDLLPIVPADRTGRRGEIDYGEFFFGIDPP